MATQLTETLFSLESTQFAEERLRKARATLDDLIARLANSGLHGSRSPAVFLARFLSRQEGFTYRCDDPVESFTLVGTLSNRAGSCLGLTTLYVCLGETLNLRLRPILFERHIGVGLRGDTRTLHLETSKGAGILPERWVHRLYGPPLRPFPLSAPQFLAVHLSNRAASVLAPKGALEDALYLVDAALELYPDYLAAWINRAAILLELEDWSAATDSLDRAISLGPHDCYRGMIELLMERLVVGH